MVKKIKKIEFILPKVCERCFIRNNLENVKKEFIEKEEDCKLCNGAFLKIDRITQKIIEELNSLPGIETFSIGTSLPKSSEALEENLWDFVDLNHAKSLKSELNKEIIERIEKNTKYKFSNEPDVRLIYNLKNEEISKQITSLYIYGKYNKLKRGIRQTKKEGSSEESVEGLIEKVLLKEIGGKKSKCILHGSGREDIDVLMLGEGRPFVIEVTNPIKRNITNEELSRISEKINKENNGKINVKLEKMVKKEFIEIIKRAKFDKEYEAIVKLDRPITEKELKSIPKNLVLFQRTPKRVLIRRADLIRKRKIKSLEFEIIDNETLKLHIVSQSGTYIKEFITGDDGRTKPSISSLLNRKAICEQLNVLSIKSEWLDEFW